MKQRAFIEGEAMHRALATGVKLVLNRSSHEHTPPSLEWRSGDIAVPPLGAAIFGWPEQLSQLVLNAPQFYGDE